MNAPTQSQAREALQNAIALWGNRCTDEVQQVWLAETKAALAALTPASDDATVERVARKFAAAAQRIRHFGDADEGEPFPSRRGGQHRLYARVGNGPLIELLNGIEGEPLTVADLFAMDAALATAPRPSDDVAKLRDALAALKNVQRHMNVLLKENVEVMTATVCDHVVAAHSICGEAIAASILTPADDVAKLREAVRNLRQEQQQRCGDPEYHEGYDHALGDVLDALAALADGEKSNG